MKPLDSSDGAVGSASIEPDGSLVSRIAPSAPILAEPDAAEEGSSERDGSADGERSDGSADDERSDGSADEERSADAAREPPMVVPSRVSQVVPVGTSDAEAAPRARISDIVPVSPEPAPRVRASEMVPVDPAVREARAAFRKSEFGETLHGTGFTSEDDEEATTVDAGAALTEGEQLALMRRIQTAMGHSAMEETAPYGTPAPDPVQPMSATPGLEYDSRSPFKHTMLLGLPQLRPQPPSEAPATSSPDVVQPAAAEDSSSGAIEGAAPSPAVPPTSAEPALMASLVRVVGPPTQPPPRRVRRPGSFSPDGANEPDHEAFVLTHPLSPPEGRRSNVPGPPSAPGALVPGSLVTASGAPISLSSANLGPGNILGNGVASTGLGSHGFGGHGSGGHGSGGHGLAGHGVGGHGSGNHGLGDGDAGPSSVSAAGHAGVGSASAAAIGGGTSLGAAVPGNGAYGNSGYGNGGYGNGGYGNGGTTNGGSPNRDRANWDSPNWGGAHSAISNASGSTGYGNTNVSRGSVPPQLILPPPPRPQDYEPASSPVASRPSPPPLRASIEPPAALLRTRPPASRPSVAPPPSLHDLPTSDPFAGFVAPPPSMAQRGLVVVVVALAVVGVCALVAIAFGLLGKTGW